MSRGLLGALVIGCAVVVAAHLTSSIRAASHLVARAVEARAPGEPERFAVAKGENEAIAATLDVELEG